MYDYCSAYRPRLKAQAYQASFMFLCNEIINWTATLHIDYTERVMKIQKFVIFSS